MINEKSFNFAEDAAANHSNTFLNGLARGKWSPSGDTKINNAPTYYYSEVKFEGNRKPFKEQLTKPI